MRPRRSERVGHPERPQGHGTCQCYRRLPLTPAPVLRGAQRNACWTLSRDRISGREVRGAVKDAGRVLLHRLLPKGCGDFCGRARRKPQRGEALRGSASNSPARASCRAAAALRSSASCGVVACEAATAGADPVRSAESGVGPSAPARRGQVARPREWLAHMEATPFCSPTCAASAHANPHRRGQQQAMVS